MSYIIHSYQEVTRPLVAIFQVRQTRWQAEPIIGIATYRDMDAKGRAAENLLMPILAPDLVDWQAHSHDTRAEVEESHAPQVVVQDAALYEAVLAGGVWVDQDAAGKWYVLTSQDVTA